LTARVTLAGDVEPHSQYLVNIKRIDQSVREAVPDLSRALREAQPVSFSALLALLYGRLRGAWREGLESVALSPSPFFSLAIHTTEDPMTRLSQKFEFSASHRLHNPALSDEENRETFGKCNNPLSHGHNYDLQVTLLGTPDASGQLIDLPAFERTVAETVIERLDHKHLNAEVPEFRDVIPSVENIAKVIYRLLSPKLKTDHSKLASVTVWETPKTWCEYSEEVTRGQPDKGTR
jgi:6-pyruvoyltetrahydropterin/6-carboxytetrahydropterin synthase